MTAVVTSANPVQSADHPAGRRHALAPTSSSDYPYTTTKFPFMRCADYSAMSLPYVLRVTAEQAAPLQDPDGTITPLLLVTLGLERTFSASLLPAAAQSDCFKQLATSLDGFIITIGGLGCAKDTQQCHQGRI